LDEKVELGKSLGVIELKDINPAVRKHFIFRGDHDCYRKAKRASDGFEHGFLGFDCARESSREIRVGTAAYVRKEFLELLGVERSVGNALLQAPYDKPLGRWPLVHYIRGRLLGDPRKFAPEGRAYPYLQWHPEVRTCSLENGEMRLEVDHRVTAELGNGVRLEQLSYEAWEPG
jgi:hypothetical protein